MPLQDSFSSRRPPEQSSGPHAPKPNRLPKPPSREDLEFTLSCAVTNPQVPLGLMWKKGHRAYLLTVMSTAERRAEPAWALHSGTDAERSVLWSYRSGDINFIYNLLGQLNAVSPANEPAPVGSGTQSGDFPAWANDFTLSEVVLVPGATFADHYEIISEVGLGGMGVVYKARDQQFDRIVAVKLLHGHLVSDPVSKKRFEQEAKAAMTLSHPNLISVYHYGFSSQGLPFLVMEYIDGYGLDELMQSKRQLELGEFLDIFIQSCEGLAHAHEKGIIHRDLKPSNLMIARDTETIELKIVDFGIAKLLVRGDSKQDLTMAGDILGSPLYMSPEQCKGDNLDVRSDIYSLGCLMYHAISGQLPFEGETPLQTLGKHMCDPPAPLNVIRPDLVVPLKLQDAICKALEKAPENRYESVRKLQAVLKQLKEELNPAPSTPEAIPVSNIASQLLVDSGDLPSTTLQAALKVQKMLRAGSLTLNQAADALGRAHLAGGQITVGDTNAESRTDKGIETPVEAILIEAGLITNAMWRTLLSLHQKIRMSQMTKEEAIAELRRLHPRATPVPKKEERTVPKDVLEMIKHAGIVTTPEIEEAARVANEEGTELAKRLVALGKIDNKTLLAARQCLSLMEGDRLRLDRAVIALLYCHRCRVGFYEAVEDLGWERP